MIQTAVESSNIDRVGWQDETLLVQFKRGHVYKYSGVPLSVYNEMVYAESVGSYFARNVGKNYPYAQIELSDAKVLGFT